MSRVLVLNPDFVGTTMAGPAIRFSEIAKELSKGHQVTLGVPNDAGFTISGVTVVKYGASNLESLVGQHDIVVISGSFILMDYPFLKKAEQVLVVDLYAPEVLETLEIQSSHDKRDKQIAALNDLISTGDFFICASERQRDFWLGVMTATHRIDAEAYKQDSTLRKLIDVVAFGLPAEPPVHGKQVLKGVYPGIKKDDTVLIWAGGVYDWLDVKSLILAMETIGRTRRDIKLFFMGVKHPNPNTIRMQAVDDAISLSQKLGLYDKTVFFNDWVPYDERASYLLEADIGLSLHFDHLETRFSFRTRMLDYIWAALPIVCTRGDTLADLVEDRGLGKTVPPESPDDVAAAVLELTGTPGEIAGIRDAFSALQKEYSWDKVVRPLAEFCNSPQRTRRDWVSNVCLEDMSIRLPIAEKMLIDKNNHIANLEDIIKSHEDTIKTYNEFPGSWLHVITRVYRRLFKRNAQKTVIESGGHE